MSGLRNIAGAFKRTLAMLGRMQGFVPALAALAVAMALHYLFLHSFGKSFPGIFFVYLMALMIGAWCGYVPGILSTLLMVLAVPFLFTPGFKLAAVNYSGLAVLALTSIIISKTSAGRRHAEAMLQGMNRELERRVREQTAALEHANTALQEQVAELKRANADLEQFAYSASHDLQEPLRMVSLFTEMLRRRYVGKLDEDADIFIGHAVTGASRMQALIHDLRSYITIGRHLEPAGSSDANVAIGLAIANLQAPILENSAEVTYQSLPVVSMDQVHLEQLFQNLISNAIKYRSKDVPRIYVRAVQDDGCWRFSVEDNGIGIDPEYSEQIFGVFKRLHTQAEYDGTGMGLAICQRIVERYEGRIWVESAPGSGSTFNFILPQRRSGSGFRTSAVVDH